ncbi:MAG TPA: hypothetical protein VKV06_12055 [Acidimicrobiales bacterium]|nr:hypothetical protein [Acidimicrobiales bacterium]
MRKRARTSTVLVPIVAAGVVTGGVFGVLAVTNANGSPPNEAAAQAVTVGSARTASPAAPLASSSSATAAASSTPNLEPITYSPTGLGGGLDRPAGVAASGSTVYVSNTAPNVVASIAHGITTPVAGSLTAFGEHGDGGKASKASVYQPNGLAVSKAGNLYIADTGDHVVREVNTKTGVITRVAGSGVAGDKGLGHSGKQAELDSPTALAFNKVGDLFVADPASNRVDEVLTNGSIVAFAGNGQAGYRGDGHKASGSELDQPTGVAVDSKGNVYIADSGNNVIRRVDAKTGIITTVAGNVAADASNDGHGGFFGDGGPATSARLNDPQSVAVDGAGDLFIADTFNNAIREVTPAGTISTVVNSAAPSAGSETFGVPGNSHLNTPYALSIEPSTDTLYIADTHNSRIAAVTGLAQSGNAAGPTAPANS